MFSNRETGELNVGLKLKMEHEIQNLNQAKESGLWYNIRLSGGGELLSPRLGHSLIHIPSANQNQEDITTTRVMCIGGGNHEGAISEIWEFILSSNSKEVGTSTKDSSVAIARKLPSLEGLTPKYEFLCSQISSKIWIFGGADAALTFNDVGYIDNGMWVEVLTNSGEGTKPPSPRTQGSNSAVVVFDGKSYLCVFAGGEAGVDAVFDGHLYLYDVEELCWIIVPLVGDTPPTTQGHVLTAFGSKVFIHGGLNGSNLHDSVYMIDVAGAVSKPRVPCSWIPIESEEISPIPPGRAAHGIAKGDGEKFYIFGGLGQHGALNDVWEFDGVSKSWKDLTGKRSNTSDTSSKLVEPSPRFGIAMMCISLEKCNETCRYLLVHGGMNSEGEVFNDLWVYKL